MNTTLPLVLSIVQFVFCCNVFAVVAIVFAALAIGAKNMGDIEGARGKIKVAYIVMGAALALQIVGGVVGLLTGMFNVVTGSSL